jgi:hypothetical protein
MLDPMAQTCPWPNPMVRYSSHDLRRRFTLGLQSFRASGLFYDKELETAEATKSEGLEGLTSMLFSQI